MKTLGCVVVLALVQAACGAAPPMWYEGGGTQWTLPLVNAAENGELIVPVTIHGQGPHLFILDPDASCSVIDDGVARELGLYSSQKYVRIVNQNDVSVPRKFYEVLNLETGDLRIRNKKMINAPAGSLDQGNRRISGILGADLLSRTIVIRVDRHNSLVHLALTGHAEIPPGAVAIRGHLHHGAFYLPARINGHQQILRLHLARRVSSLNPDAIRSLGLSSAAANEVIVDETGTRRTVTAHVVADLVELDGIGNRNVSFLAYLDQRIPRDYTFDGFLGQDLLAQHDIVVDRDHETLYLAPHRVASAR